MFSSYLTRLIFANFEIIEKNKFHVLIKHYFLKSKTVAEAKAKLDKHLVSLHFWLEWFISGLVHFNVAEWTQNVMNV